MNNFIFHKSNSSGGRERLNESSKLCWNRSYRVSPSSLKTLYLAIYYKLYLFSYVYAQMFALYYNFDINAHKNVPTFTTL